VARLFAFGASRSSSFYALQDSCPLEDATAATLDEYFGIEALPQRPEVQRSSGSGGDEMQHDANAYGDAEAPSEYYAPSGSPHYTESGEYGAYADCGGGYANDTAAFEGSNGGSYPGSNSGHHESSGGYGARGNPAADEYSSHRQQDYGSPYQHSDHPRGSFDDAPFAFASGGDGGGDGGGGIGYAPEASSDYYDPNYEAPQEQPEYYPPSHNGGYPQHDDGSYPVSYDGGGYRAEAPRHVEQQQHYTQSYHQPGGGYPEHHQPQQQQQQQRQQERPYQQSYGSGHAASGPSGSRSGQSSNYHGPY
jgi:hypothetical protein